MKNALALPDSLVFNIACLIKFIRDCPSSDTFWEARSSSSVLNSSLNEVEFELQSGNFIVRHTDKTKSKKEAIAKKDTLSKFNLTLTDPIKGLPVKFAELQQGEAGLTVKAAIKKIENIKQTILRQVDTVIESLQNETNRLDNNENKGPEISNFFYILKNILVSNFEASNFLSAETVILEAQKLSSVSSELDNIKSSIIPLITNDFNPETISKASLFYARVVHSIKKHFPEKSESDVYNLIDTYIGIKINERDEKQAFKAFNWGYQGKEPGFFIVEDQIMSIYEETKKLTKKLSPIKEKYLKLLQLIDNILDPTVKEKLHTVVNNYFTIKLATVNDNREKLLEDFKKFKIESEDIIKNYKEANQPNLEQLTYLYRILHEIAKIIPNFIASKEDKNNFFFKHTPEGKKIITLEGYVHSVAPAA